MAATRKGRNAQLVETVSVRTCENVRTKVCGEFVYLGSKIPTSTSATPEVNRRIGMALTSFGSLNRIWKANSLSRKTKAALYVAIILSIMLYNAEVWPIKIQDIKALEGAHVRMMRVMMASKVRNAHISNEELLRAFKLPKIAELISYKRLSWVGHAVRRGENDRSRVAVLKALTNKKSKWSKSVRKDFEDRQLDIREVVNLANDRSSWKKSIIYETHALHWAKT